MRDLQRIRHLASEVPSCSDLNDQGSFDEQLRWWHNRAMHQAYGIACGLGVKIDHGRAHVGYGLAYDHLSRELVLPRDVWLEVPRQPGPLTLFIRRREPGPECPVPTCCGEPVERSCDGIELYWAEWNGLSITHGVPLHRVGAGAGTFEPIRVNPMRRARVANGSTIPGATPWHVHAVRVKGLLTVLRATVRVDLTAHGLGERPCCFTWLHQGSDAESRGPFAFALSTHVLESTNQHLTHSAWLIPLTVHAHVRHASLLAVKPPSRNWVAVLNQQRFYVTWLAVECDAGAARGGRP